jgi:hypothetical protein
MTDVGHGLTPVQSVRVFVSDHDIGLESRVEWLEVNESIVVSEGFAGSAVLGHKSGTLGTIISEAARGLCPSRGAARRKRSRKFSNRPVILPLWRDEGLGRRKRGVERDSGLVRRLPLLRWRLPLLE